MWLRGWQPMQCAADAIWAAKSACGQAGYIVKKQAERVQPFADSKTWCARVDARKGNFAAGKVVGSGMRGPERREAMCGGKHNVLKVQPVCFEVHG